MDFMDRTITNPKPNTYRLIDTRRVWDTGKYETMVFKCRKDGEILNPENPLYEATYEIREDAERGHRVACSEFS